LLEALFARFYLRFCFQERERGNFITRQPSKAVSRRERPKSVLQDNHQIDYKTATNISGWFPSSRGRRRRGWRNGEKWRREKGDAIEVDVGVDGAKSVIEVESRRGYEQSAKVTRVSAK